MTAGDHMDEVCACGVRVQAVRTCNHPVRVLEIYLKKDADDRFSDTASILRIHIHSNFVECPTILEKTFQIQSSQSFGQDVESRATNEFDWQINFLCQDSLEKTKNKSLIT
jgi:hypothetical protein